MKNRLFLLFLAVLTVSVSVLAVTSKDSIHIFAITDDGQGLSATLSLELVSGTGKIFSSVNPLVGTSTQNAERVAVELAKNYSSEVNKFDYKFEINSTASIVDGPSAGAATSLLTITMLQNRPLPDFVGMTGTIDEAGQVGTVGGVFEKAKEASKIGIKLFIIPKGESKQIVRTDKGVESVNLVEYAPKNWSMKVVEVQTIDEAIKFAFSDPASIDVNEQILQTQFDFVPQAIAYDPQAAPLYPITQRYWTQAKDLVKDAKDSVNKTLLSDQQLVGVMLDSLNESEQVLEKSKALLDQNFLYSSANYSFTAKVNALMVRDIAQNPSILNDNSTIFHTKLVELQKELDLLQVQLSQGVLPDQIDWQIAAEQRLIWAKNNVKDLLTTQTIVVDTGNTAPTDAYAIPLDRLRNYEFAVAWKEVASDLAMQLQSATKQTKLNSSAREFSNQKIVEAENRLPLIDPSQRDDIQRRYDGAKASQLLNWDLASAMDADSVTALINSETQTKDSGLPALEATLNQKISDLEQKLGVSNEPFAWSRLYLDHARYFQQEVAFFNDKNQTAQALEAAKSGVSIVFLAESSFATMQKVYELVGENPKEPFTSATPFGVPNGSQGGTVVPVNEPVNGLLIAAILLIVLSWGVIAFLVLKHKKTDLVPIESSLHSNRRKFLNEGRELDLQLIENKISMADYENKRAELLERFHDIDAKLPALTATGLPGNAAPASKTDAKKTDSKKEQAKKTETKKIDSKKNPEPEQKKSASKTSSDSDEPRKPLVKIGPKGKVSR
ncbi:MAG: S16 family serine protease [Candidatus Micrarchaeota archaeon]